MILKILSQSHAYFTLLEPCLQKVAYFCKDGRVFSIEPGRSSLLAKPGQLTFGIPARRDNRLTNHFIVTGLAGKKGPHLPVTDRAHCGQPGVQVTAPAQCPDLVNETGFQHGPETCLDAPLQQLAIRRRQHQFDRLAGQGRRPPLRMEVTDRPACELKDLKRTLNALRIIGMDAGSRLRIDPCQPRMQGCPAVRFGLALQSGT